MYRMFYQCWRLKDIDKLNLNTSKVTNMSGMFVGTRMKSFTFKNFDTSKVTNMSEMFFNAAIEVMDLTNLKTDSLTDTSEMFHQMSYLTTIYAYDNLKFPNVTSSKDMFQSCYVLVGGAGTKFTAANRDVTYARVDKAGQPGYFTLPPRCYGDVNGDGNVTADDAIITARMAAGYGDYNKKYEEKYADIDGSGKVTADDAIIIARCAADYGSYREKYIKPAV